MKWSEESHNKGPNWLNYSISDYCGRKLEHKEWYVQWYFITPRCFKEELLTYILTAKPVCKTIVQYKTPNQSVH
jgi:hypothetical protein